MSSTRLPGKILREVKGRPILWYLLERLKKSKEVDKIVVATSVESADHATLDFCKDYGVECYRGSQDDVLKRYIDCMSHYSEYETIVRITGDCPLLDPLVVDRVITHFRSEDVDYASNIEKETYPDGIDVEVFKRGALIKSEKRARLGSEREHVTLGIRNDPRFKRANVENEKDMSRFRLTVDNPEDFKVMSFLIENYGHELPFEAYCDILLENRDVMAINSKILRNEGLAKSLKEDKQG